MALLAQYKGLNKPAPQTVAPSIPTPVKDTVAKITNTYQNTESAVSSKIPTLKAISSSGSSFAKKNPKAAQTIYSAFEKAHTKTEKYGTPAQRETLAGYTFGSYLSLQRKPVKTSAMFAAGLAGGRAITAVSKVGKAFGAGTKAARMAKATELGVVGIYGLQTTKRIMDAPTAYEAGQRAADAMYTEILPVMAGAGAAGLARKPKVKIKSNRTTRRAKAKTIKKGKQKAAREERIKNTKKNSSKKAKPVEPSKTKSKNVMPPRKTAPTTKKSTGKTAKPKSVKARKSRLSKMDKAQRREEINEIKRDVDILIEFQRTQFTKARQQKIDELIDIVRVEPGHRTWLKSAQKKLFDLDTGIPATPVKKGNYVEVYSKRGKLQDVIELMADEKGTLQLVPPQQITKPVTTIVPKTTTRVAKGVKAERVPKIKQALYRDSRLTKNINKKPIQVTKSAQKEWQQYVQTMKQSSTTTQRKASSSLTQKISDALLSEQAFVLGVQNVVGIAVDMQVAQVQETPTTTDKTSSPELKKPRPQEAKKRTGRTTPTSNIMRKPKATKKIPRRTAKATTTKTPFPPVPAIPQVARDKKKTPRVKRVRKTTGLSTTQVKNSVANINSIFGGSK